MTDHSGVQSTCFTNLEPSACLSLGLSVSPGCTDGMVGVAARVASAQAPWLTLEEESIPDLTNHIAGLEAMLTEMQLRVRQTQGEPSVPVPNGFV